MVSTKNPLPQVPPRNEQAPFTHRYKRYGWEATTYFVYTKGGEVRAYVSDYSVTGTPTLQDLSRISTKVHADLDNFSSRIRLEQWSREHAHHFTTWRQREDNTLELVA